MSLDLSLIKVMETEVFDTNMTHNVTPMWRKAGVYDALYNSERHLAGEFIDVLIAGVADMEANADEYRALNAQNEWGTYGQALPWLREVLAAFERYPDGKIRISK